MRARKIIKTGFFFIMGLLCIFVFSPKIQTLASDLTTVAPTVQTANSSNTTSSSSNTAIPVTSALTQTAQDNFIQSHSTTSYDSQTGDTTTTITNMQMRAILINAGVPSDELGVYGLDRSAGVNKFVVHGALRDGNFNLYINESTLIQFHQASLSVDALEAVIYASVGSYIRSAVKVVQTVYQAYALAHITSGKDFSVRHWDSVHTYNQ